VRFLNSDSYLLALYKFHPITLGCGILYATPAIRSATEHLLRVNILSFMCSFELSLLGCHAWQSITVTNFSVCILL